MDIRNQITKNAESKLYFLIFFFFSAAMASVVYNVAIDVYVVDEENRHPYFRVFRPGLFEEGGEFIQTAPNQNSTPDAEKIPR